MRGSSGALQQTAAVFLFPSLLSRPIAFTRFPRQLLYIYFFFQCAVAVCRHPATPPRTPLRILPPLPFGSLSAAVLRVIMGSFCLRDRESQVVMRASDCGWLQITLAQAQRSQHLLCKPLTPRHQGARIRRKKDLSAVVHSIC